MKKFLFGILAMTVSGLCAFSQSYPQYINTAANHLQMNGADWSSLRQKMHQRLEPGDTSTVRILHIGDSHIQAEFVTNRLRQLLQEHYGNAGRGLLVPLRLAGTNQSHDYSVTAAQGAGGTWTQARLLKCPWPVRPGFGGVAAQPSEAVDVTWRTSLPGHEIANARLFTSAGMRNINAQGVDSVVTPIAAGETIYALLTDNGKPGLLYSAIGNNGACYNDYLLIDDFAASTKVFNPDLIVLSMGTNEAFSYMTEAEIERSVRNLLSELRRHNPGAEFVILGPMECQKNRRHGQRPLSPDYDILERNAGISNQLSAIAASEHVPFWNLYDVAGGHGSSVHWLDDKLMNRDRIHLVKAGYEVEAALLFDALTEQW